jgi:hypothetical protein
MRVHGRKSVRRRRTVTGRRRFALRASFLYETDDRAGESAVELLKARVAEDLTRCVVPYARRARWLAGAPSYSPRPGADRHRPQSSLLG